MSIALHHKRIITELCQIIGFKAVDDLFNGGKLRVNENFLVSFIYDEPLSPEHLLVYVDMGPLEGDREKTLSLFMKINFELGAGARGTLCLHPQTDRLFYAFRFPLKEEASGQELLDAVLQFLAWLGDETADAPDEAKKDTSAGKEAALASRMRASRFIQQSHPSAK